jgi:hypothetical protein
MYRFFKFIKNKYMYFILKKNKNTLKKKKLK